MKNIFRTCPRQLLQFIRWEWHIINNSGLFHKNGFKNIIKCLFKILKNSRKTSIVYLRLLWLLSFTAPFLALFCLGQNETGNLWVLFFFEILSIRNLSVEIFPMFAKLLDLSHFHQLFCRVRSLSFSPEYNALFFHVLFYINKTNYFWNNYRLIICKCRRDKNWFFYLKQWYPIGCCFPNIKAWSFVWRMRV